VDKSEYITKSVRATGIEGIPCTNPRTPPRSDTETDRFTITRQPGLPPEADGRIPVRIQGSASKHSQDYFGAGFTPSANIRSSSGTIVAKVSLTSDTADRTILLSPGDYTMYATATWLNCDTRKTDRAYISASFLKWTNERLYEKPAGGVRVVKIEKFDSNNTLLLSQEYDYKMENGYSSGFIHKEPEYTYPVTRYRVIGPGHNGGIIGPQGEIGCNLTMAFASLGVTDGGHIGYKRVTISQISDDAQSTDNGKTVLDFTASPNVVYDPTPIRPSASNTHYTGLLKNSKVLDKNGTLVQEAKKTYEYNVNSTRGLKITFNGGFSIPGDEHKYEKGFYSINIGHSKMKVQEAKTRLSNQNHITKKEYQYDAALQNLKQEKIYYDNNKIITNSFYYPENHLGLQNVTTAQKNAYADLLSKHRVKRYKLLRRMMH